MAPHKCDAIRGVSVVPCVLATVFLINANTVKCFPYRWQVHTHRDMHTIFVYVIIEETRKEL